MARGLSVLLGLGAAMLFSVAAACSGSSSSTSGGGGGGGGGGDDDAGEAGSSHGEGGGTSDAVERCAKSSCDQMRRCSPSYLAYLYVDEATCLTKERALCAAGLTVADTGATEAGLLACADARDAYQCTGSPFKIPDACIFQGSRADGATCGTSDQCVSKTCNYGTGTCGTCAAPKGAGESCAGGATCAPGLQCVNSGTGLACAKPQAVGQSCDATHACGSDPLAYCIGGTCQKPGGEGATCDTTGKLPPCDPYALLSCNAQGKCAAPTFVGSGQTCDPAHGVYCQGETACVSGTCVARVKTGEACDSTARFCEIGTSCISGTCQEYGASCK